MAQVKTFQIGLSPVMVYGMQTGRAFHLSQEAKRVYRYLAKRSREQDKRLERREGADNEASDR